MKKRKGFVSNSSSSSFVCEVCGSEESGMDMCLDDAGMAECKNGHIVCQEHMIDRVDKMTLEELRTIYSTFEDITDDEDVSDADLKEVVKEKLFEGDDGYYEVPIIACPVCNFNVLIDDDYINYIQMKLGVTRHGVLNEIRDKYKSYDEFREAIKVSIKK